MEPEPLPRVFIIPGNGCPSDSIMDCNYYDVRACAMPDPDLARRSIWLPHLQSVVLPSDIVVGHSSGAQAAMRLAETMPLRALFLVSACHTDLGNENERASGWYPPGGGPWDWDAIKRNCGEIVQFHSADDPFIGMDEATFVHQKLDSKLHAFEDRSHFFEPADAGVIFDEILSMMMR